MGAWAKAFPSTDVALHTFRYLPEEADAGGGRKEIGQMAVVHPSSTLSEGTSGVNPI